MHMQARSVSLHSIRVVGTAPGARADQLAIDLSICPHCGGRRRVIADVTRPDVIQGI
jgi:hypothetical protein